MQAPLHDISTFPDPGGSVIGHLFWHETIHGVSRTKGLHVEDVLYSVMNALRQNSSKGTRIR